MKPDYKNWVPKGMMIGLVAGAAALLVLLILFGGMGLGVQGLTRTILTIILGVAFLAIAAAAVWSVAAYRAFLFRDEDSLARKIISGVASCVKLPDGGKGLDVGCGSGALTIACAKANPGAEMLGIDRWEAEYVSYSCDLCRRNSAAEGVKNARFAKGDAIKLDFPDETFDAVTSNYVYHNIGLVDKQQLLRETLRVLKKGGTFAIHDLMSPVRYGDMQKFVDSLKAQGYEKVELIDTTRGMFMSRSQAQWLLLGGSTLLIGTK